MEGYDNADWTLGRILATENYMAFASFPDPILIFWMGPENEASMTSSKCLKCYFAYLDSCGLRCLNNPANCQVNHTSERTFGQTATAYMHI